VYRWPDVELRHLRYFAALAEELHFGRAARRLSITQPPLSFNIRRLEEELGARLLDRDSKRVALTPAGAAFLAEARHILAQVERARELTRAVAGGRVGRLEVGFTGSMVYRGVPEMVSAFSAGHPGIEVALRELSTIEQIDALAHGRLDAGFVNDVAIPQGLDGEPLVEEPFVCCLPETHPAARLPVIELRSLAREPFVMFARDVSPANYDRVISVCAEAGFQPDTRFAARQWLTIAALVASGLGVALVPESIARTKVAGACFVPIREKHARSNAFCLWNPDRILPGLEPFLAAVRATVRARRAMRRKA
jgi:DNA-binding transcriptional LysR family regulator